MIKESLLFLLPLTFCSIAQASEKDSLPNHAIEEVVVKGYRFDLPLRDAPHKVEVITRRDIRHTAAQNLGDLLKKNTTAESVDMQGLTGGIEFRGFSPGGAGTNVYSVMLQDGLPIGTKNAAATFLSNLEGVEILKGPFSSLYGSGAMGGVVNLLTRQSRGCLSGNVSASYGSYNTAEASVSMGGNLTGKLDFDLTLDYFNQIDNYKTGHCDLFHRSAYEKEVLDAASYGMVYPNSSYDKQRASLRLGHDLHGGWRMNLYNDVFRAGKARGNGMIWGLYDQTDKSVLRHYHRFEITGPQGRHNFRFTPYYSNETSDYLNSGYATTRSRYAYRTFGLLAQDAMKFRFGQLVFGVDNFSQRYISGQSTESGTPTSPYQPDYYNFQTGIFAQFHLSLFERRLTANAGVRYDNTFFRTTATPLLEMTPSGKSYNSVNPNLAAKYKPLEWLNLHASIGRGFLAPEAFKTTGRYVMEYISGDYVSRTIYEGNPDLKPELSLTGDAGIGIQTRDGALQADATWFSTRHKNQITTQSGDFVTYTYINSPRSTVRGLEFLFSYDLGKTLHQEYSLRFFANYTHIYHDLMTTPSGDIPRKYLSRNNVVFGTDFSDRRFSARISGRYLGCRTEDNFLYLFGPDYSKVPFETASGIPVRPGLVNDPVIELPDFMVFDLYLSYTLRNRFTLSFTLANFLSENYAERDGYYLPGRNFSLQASVRF